MPDEGGINWDIMLPVVGACSGIAACCSVSVVVYCWFKVRHDITGSENPSRRRLPDFRSAFGGGGSRRPPPPRSPRRPQGNEVEFSNFNDDAPDMSRAEEGLHLGGRSGSAASMSAATRTTVQFAAAQKLRRNLSPYANDDDVDALDHDDDTARPLSRVPSTGSVASVGRGRDRGATPLPTQARGSFAAPSPGRRGGRSGSRSERIQTNQDGSQDVFV